MIFRSKPSSGLLIAMLMMVDEWWRMREREGGVAPYYDNRGVFIQFEVIDMERERDEILLYAIDR